MNALVFLWRAEVAKAIVRGDTTTLSMFDLLGAPPPAAAPKGTTHQGTAEVTHGGRLHPETRTDKTGRTQTRWLSPEQPPAAPKPAKPPAPPGGDDAPKNIPSTWSTTPPKRDDAQELGRWLSGAPEGTTLATGGLNWRKTNKAPGFWRLSGRRDGLSDKNLALLLGPPLDPDDEGNDRDWLRSHEWATPKMAEGAIRADLPGEGHIEIHDPVIEMAIPAGAEGRFLDILDKLQKRATRSGLQPLTFEETGRSVATLEVGGGRAGIIRRKVEQIHYRITMPDLSLPGGWRFLGACEHGAHGTKVHLRHAPLGVDTKAYRFADNSCDHCHAKRNRKTTVVLQNAQGEVKRVGTDCVKDYLGHDVPLTGWSSIFDQMKEELYGFEGSEDERGRSTVVDTGNFLSEVAMLIRVDGRYVPARRRDGDGGHGDFPTAGKAWALTCDIDGRLRKKLGYGWPTEADAVRANRALDWARALPVDAASDYLHNLRVSLAGNDIGKKEYGFAASVFSAWSRDNDQKNVDEGGKQRQDTGTHVGAVGDKIGTTKKHQLKPFEATVTAYKPLDGGQYGPTYLIKVKDANGNTFTTFASNPQYENAAESVAHEGWGTVPPATGVNTADSPHPGDRIHIHGGSIKKHDDFKGQKATVLTRMKHDRLGLPDVSAAALPEAALKKRRSPYGGTVDFDLRHDDLYIRHAVAATRAAGVHPGDPAFAPAFEANLRAVCAAHPADIGAQHYESSRYHGQPTSAVARELDDLEHEIRHAKPQERWSRDDHSAEWRREQQRKDAEEAEAGKSLLAFAFRREALKNQFGLFGPFATAARAASPGGAWGGAAAPGTHVEMRTDKTGRMEHRTVSDTTPAPAQPAGKPAQLKLFGGSTPSRTPRASLRLSVAPACRRCGGTIPKLDPHANGGACGACSRTADWLDQSGPHSMGSMFSH